MSAQRHFVSVSATLTRSDLGHPGVTDVDRLFDDAWRYLLSVANRHLPRDLRSKVDASDLVQETFLKAHRGLPDFPGRTDTDLKLWLRRILLNHLSNVTRHYRGTAKRNLAREVSIAAGGEQVAGCDEPPALLITQEMHEALWQAVDRLPEQHRQVVRWHNVDHLPFPEIGRRLGNSADAARKVWERALEKLARMLRHKWEQSQSVDEQTDEPLPFLLPFRAG
jgi:RNA polymerase sigma-70 factor, ECF subfamily